MEQLHHITCDCFYRKNKDYKRTMWNRWRAFPAQTFSLHFCSWLSCARAVVFNSQHQKYEWFSNRDKEMHTYVCSDALIYYCTSVTMYINETLVWMQTMVPRGNIFLEALWHQLCDLGNSLQSYSSSVDLCLSQTIFRIKLSFQITSIKFCLCNTQFKCLSR